MTTSSGRTAAASAGQARSGDPAAGYRWVTPPFTTVPPPPATIAGLLRDVVSGVRAVVTRTVPGPPSARFRAGRQASRTARADDATLPTTAGLGRWWCLVRAGIVTAAAPEATAADVDRVAWTLRRTTRDESHATVRFEARRWWAHAAAAVLALGLTAVAVRDRFDLPVWPAVLFGAVQVLTGLAAVVASDRAGVLAAASVPVGIVVAVAMAAAGGLPGALVVAAAVPLIGTTVALWVLLVAAGFVFVRPWIPARWRLRPDPYAVLVNSVVTATAGLSTVRRMDDPDVWQETMLVPYWWNGLPDVPDTEAARLLRDALRRPEAQVVTSPQLTTALHDALVACVGDRCPRRDGTGWTLARRPDAVPDRSFPGPVWSLGPETAKALPTFATEPVQELGRAADALEKGFPAAGADSRRRLAALGQEVARWVRDRQLDLQRPGGSVVDRVEPLLVRAIFDVVAGRWENLTAAGDPAPPPVLERIGRRATSAAGGAVLGGLAAWLWVTGEQVAAVALLSPAVALLKGENPLDAAVGALGDLAKRARP